MRRTRSEHLAMMRNRPRWPAWPLLPLKRIVDGTLETAVLFASDPVLFLPGANMFDLRGYDRSLAVVANLENLADAGWEVD